MNSNLIVLFRISWKIEKSFSRVVVGEALESHRRAGASNEKKRCPMSGLMVLRAATEEKVETSSPNEIFSRTSRKKEKNEKRAK